VARVRILLALVGIALGAGAIVVVAAGGDDDPAGAGSRPEAAGACDAVVLRGVLPEWARTGFSDPRPRLPHAVGGSGDIAALIFGYPLTSPPLRNRSNKILWVSRVPVKPLSDLRIRARLMRGDRPAGPPVRRTVEGGPGPSIVDLPEAGCWRLDLSWSGHTDQLDLAYVPRSWARRR
jgi:hypothetical protein